MTPSETLRAAADRLDALDKAAVPGPWIRFRSRNIDQLEGPLFVIAKVTHPKNGNPEEGTPGVTPHSADLIAALRSVTAPLAALLRNDAQTAVDLSAMVDSDDGGTEVAEGYVHPLSLAVARAILGEPS